MEINEIKDDSEWLSEGELPEASPFDAQFSAQAVISETTHAEMQQRLDDLFYSIIGEQFRHIYPPPREFEITMATEHAIVRSYRRDKSEPIALIITTTGIAQ